MAAEQNMLLYLEWCLQQLMRTLRPQVVSFDYQSHHTWLFPAKDQRPWKFLLQEMLEQNSQGETLDQCLH